MQLSLPRQSALFVAAGIFLLAARAPADSAVPSDPAGNAPVATVKGRVVSYFELQSQIQDKLNQQQELHDAQIQQLDAKYVRDRRTTMLDETGRLVDDRVLELEAASRKTTTAALLSSVKPAPVTDAQIEAFYNERATRIGQPLVKVAPKIKEFLETQNTDKAKRDYLNSLRAKYQASVTMEPLREQVAATGPARGPQSASITIVEFSDFQCPYCGQFEPELKKLMEAYPTQIRLIYRNMPIPSLHPEAQKAAEAAICADKQGKFWEMHDTLFSEQNALAPDALKEKARRLGLNTTMFDECLEKGGAIQTLNADLREAQRLGLDATPVSFINGRIIPGAVGYDELTAVIKEELQKQPHGSRLETAAR
jgi:protein-disulfide isomerase